jgi:ferritin-like metal-binding protein YciE
LIVESDLFRWKSGLYRRRRPGRDVVQRGLGLTGASSRQFLREVAAPYTKKHRVPEDSFLQSARAKTPKPGHIRRRNKFLRRWLEDKSKPGRPTMTATTADLAASDTVRTVFIRGLQNAHALEKQATQLMNRQIERLEHYPEMKQLLVEHARETEGQIQRLDDILHSLGEDSSTLKDTATQLMGNMAALAHTPMADEILKDTFANHAFENFEIAAYTSLISMAEAAGYSQYVPQLRETLEEERKAARMIFEQVEPITMKYLQREARDQKADR